MSDLPPDTPTPAPAGAVRRGLDRLLARSTRTAAIALGVYALSIGVSVLGAEFVYAVPFWFTAVVAGGVLFWLAGRWIAPDSDRSTAWRVRNLLGSMMLSLAGTAAVITFTLAGLDSVARYSTEPVMWAVAVVPTVMFAAPAGLILWIMWLVQAIIAKPAGFLRRVDANQRTLMFVLFVLAWVAGLLVLGFLTLWSLWAVVMFGDSIASDLR